MYTSIRQVVGIFKNRRSIVFQRLLMYRGYRSSNSADSSFDNVYVPFLRFTAKFALIKYIIFLVYSVRSMQEHLALPTFCNNRMTSELACRASSCYWLHKVVLNLPKFLVRSEIFIEQCSYLLVFFFLSCSMFIYAIYLTSGPNPDIKLRYRLILIIPSLIFEFLFCFLSYYATVTSVVYYSDVARTNPKYFSTAFVIFAFIISIFHATILMTHVAAVYYMIIVPVEKYCSTPTTNYSQSMSNFPRRARSCTTNASTIAPILNDTYGGSTIGYPSFCGQYNTISTNTYSRIGRPGERNTMRSIRDHGVTTEENEYLELL